MINGNKCTLTDSSCQTSR